jgi:hypothetical protein
MLNRPRLLPPTSFQYIVHYLNISTLGTWTEQSQLKSRMFAFLHPKSKWHLILILSVITILMI